MTTMINLALIDPDERNVRTAAQQADILELADDIRQHGLHNPLTVYGHPDIPGRFKLWYGHRRYAAVTTLPDMIEVECKVVPAPTSNIERIIRQVSENEKREQLNPMDLAQAYADVLADDDTLNQASVAKMFGVAQSKVSQHLLCLQMTPQLQGKIRARELGVTKACKIWNTQAREPSGQTRADHGSAHQMSGRGDDACLNTANANYAVAYNLCNNVNHHDKVLQISGACGHCWIDAGIRMAMKAAGDPAATMASFASPIEAVRTLKCTTCKCPANEWRERHCYVVRENVRHPQEAHRFQLVVMPTDTPAPQPAAGADAPDSTPTTAS